MKVLEVIARPFTARVRVSGAAILLLCASALAGNVGQWVDRNRADDQIDLLQAESDCQERLTGYLAALSLTESAYGWAALIDAYSGKAVDPDSAARVVEASASLVPLLPLRDRAVDICQRNPDFDPAAYAKEQSP